MRGARVELCAGVVVALTSLSHYRASAVRCGFDVYDSNHYAAPLSLISAVTQVFLSRRYCGWLVLTTDGARQVEVLQQLK